MPLSCSTLKALYIKSMQVLAHYKTPGVGGQPHMGGSSRLSARNRAGLVTLVRAQAAKADRALAPDIQERPSRKRRSVNGRDGKYRQQRGFYASTFLSERHEGVMKYFPSALGVDDFIARVETALCGYGFTGENSIAMTNLCRDEVTTVLKDKLEEVFGCSFNTNGLGGVLTCGVTGIKAGLSHSPVAPEDGRERYVFFSFPHIAIDEDGQLGSIYRPNRPGQSCACGALQKALIEVKREGMTRNCKIPGVHDPLDPEFTILKQRLARRLRYEQVDLRGLDLVGITAVAERVITDDLEYLIEKCVNPATADFAVVAGIQVHNWSVDLRGNNFEFVAPTKVYVVVGGEVTMLDLMQLPNLSPRQIKLLAHQGSSAAAAAGAAGGIPGALTMGRGQLEGVGGVSGSTTLHSIPLWYLVQRMGASGAMCDDAAGSEEEEEGEQGQQGPAAWRQAAGEVVRPTSPSFDLPDGVTLEEAVADAMLAAANQAAVAGGQDQSGTTVGLAPIPQDRFSSRNSLSASSGSSNSIPVAAAVGATAGMATSAAAGVDSSQEEEEEEEGEVAAAGPACKWPGWQTRLAQKKRKRKGHPKGSSDKSITMDGEGSPNTSFTTRGLVR